MESTDRGIKVPMLVFYSAVALFVTQMTGSAGDGLLTALELGGGLTVVSWLLFGRYLRADDDGLLVRTNLGSTRRIAWRDFTSLRFKTGSVSNGARTTSKVILQTADGQRVVLHDGLTHWEELEDLATRRLKIEAGLDVAAAREKAEAHWRSWISGPHTEDLPSQLFWLVGSFGSLFLLIRRMVGPHL